MVRARAKSAVKKEQVDLRIIALFLVLLAIKFMWPLYAYAVPLGFDVGMYRYLFVKHAMGFPPFHVAAMDAWALGHPLGLFFFTSLLMKIGLPVDWLVGWIWNVVPVCVLSLFAWVIAQRHGKNVGALVLLMGALSIAYFDGFAMMYWKTFVALAWYVATIHFLEKRSWWAVLTGVLTVATHHQTGLLFGLVCLSWCVLQWRSVVRSKRVQKSSWMYVAMGAMIFFIGVAWYIPVWNGAVWMHLPEFLPRSGASGGNFPSPLFYLQTSGILLTLGGLGLLLSFQKERGSLWQLSVVWSALFVVSHMVFYRRFFLQLDFFLLPFAAIGFRVLWKRYAVVHARTLFVVAVLIQSVFTIAIMRTRVPTVSTASLQEIQRLPSVLPASAFVLSADPLTTPFLRGWLLDQTVVGPGLFEIGWTAQQWKLFLLGSHADRLALVRTLPQPTYLFASLEFMQFYGDAAQLILDDPCFVPTSELHLYQILCR